VATPNHLTQKKFRATQRRVAEEKAVKDAFRRLDEQRRADVSSREETSGEPASPDNPL